MTAATKRALFAAATAIALFGCAQDAKRAPDVEYATVSYSSLPGWDSDALTAALPALRRSCRNILARSPDVPLPLAPVGGVAADWHAACTGILGLAENDAAIRRFLETHLLPVRITGGGSDYGLFTGYYEPELSGSQYPATTQAVPLYQRPEDLVQVDLGDWRPSFRGQRIAGRVVDGYLKPYHSRADIEAGALAGRAAPLAWVDDPIDAFFLHIQGSGQIRFADGAMLRVGYDGQNGHRYYPIGRHLVEAGEIDRDAVSLQTIRAWLKENPDRMRSVMDRNPSYVFFRGLDADGPLGSQGTVLTPGRSLAVDHTMVPLGAPVWVDIDYRDGAGKRLERLMVAQDTGGAIKGAVRGDVFWGAGAAAEVLAGPMKARGRQFVLLPKALANAIESGGTQPFVRTAAAGAPASGRDADKSWSGERCPADARPAQ